MTIGMVRLGEIGFDATRVKAANSRYATLTTPSIEKKLAEVARTRDEERRQSGTDPKKKPAQVPTTDPQSKVMPNKEGGFAPNYTPTALTDGESGIILDANVLDVVNESGEVLPAVDRVTELCGEAPENFLSDGGNASGAILAGLAEREINAVVPVKSTEPAADSPALRDDLTQPVPADQWEQLARNSLGQLDKSNFIYDADRNVYHCPGRRELPYESRENRNGVERMRYRSLNCDGCPLVALCLQKQKDGEPATGADGRVRNIRRDAHTDVRERAAQRMATPESKAQYARRSPIAETPFAWLKGVLGLRQFRHVGLEKVETEWRWACLTMNLKTILSVLSRLRRQTLDALSNAEQQTAEIGPAV
jgi:hypothetical protein